MHMRLCLNVEKFKLERQLLKKLKNWNFIWHLHGKMWYYWW